MPEFSVEFEVYCSCGNGLCGQSFGGNNRKSPYVTVEPCKKCLSRADDEGYLRGIEENNKTN